MVAGETEGAREPDRRDHRAREEPFRLGPDPLRDQRRRRDVDSDRAVGGGPIDGGQEDESAGWIAGGGRRGRISPPVFSAVLKTPWPPPARRCLCHLVEFENDFFRKP